MAKVKTHVHSRGARALLTSEPVVSELAARAQRVCERAISMTGDDDMLNDPYGFRAYSSRTRSRAVVFTRNEHARRSNNVHNTLLKSVDAGR